MEAETGAPRMTPLYARGHSRDISPETIAMVERRLEAGVFSTPDRLYRLALYMSRSGVGVPLGWKGVLVQAHGWMGERWMVRGGRLVYQPTKRERVWTVGDVEKITAILERCPLRGCVFARLSSLSGIPHRRQLAALQRLRSVGVVSIRGPRRMWRLVEEEGG